MIRLVNGEDSIYILPLNLRIIMEQGKQQHKQNLDMTVYRSGNVHVYLSLISVFLIFNLGYYYPPVAVENYRLKPVELAELRYMVRSDNNVTEPPRQFSSAIYQWHALPMHAHQKSTTLLLQRALNTKPSQMQSVILNYHFIPRSDKYN